MQTFIDTTTQKIWAFDADVQAIPVSGRYTFKTAAGALLAVPATLQPVAAGTVPVIPLATAQAVQNAALAAATQAAITAGFASSALGASHIYGSQITDQLNLAAAVAGGVGGSVWCASGAPLTWALTPHTAARMAQLNTDWLAFRAGLQSKYAGLLAQVAAATTPAAVQAIVWG